MKANNGEVRSCCDLGFSLVFIATTANGRDDCHLWQQGGNCSVCVAIIVGGNCSVCVWGNYNWWQLQFVWQLSLVAAAACVAIILGGNCRNLVSWWKLNSVEFSFEYLIIFALLNLFMIYITGKQINSLANIRNPLFIPLNMRNIALNSSY